jgi:ER lumen protein retaining receptor
MKLFFISSSGYILYLMKKRYKASWDPELDTFPIPYLLGGSVILGFLTTTQFSFLEVHRIYDCLFCYLLMLQDILLHSFN